MTDGSGLVWLIPPLAGVDYLHTKRSEVPCIIRYGSKGGLTINGVVFNEPMPAFPKLNEVELSNLINYINSAWGNDIPEASPAEIAKYLEQCPDK